jgi:hypothetical protein
MKTALGLFFAVAVSTALNGQLIDNLDDFEDGSTMGWFVGDPTHPFPPVNIATGGPDGMDDAYLRLTATGQPGPGSRLAVLSGPQWAGNYTAEKITHLRMDVNNFGPSDLNLRLLFEDFGGLGPPLNLALSAEAVLVPAGSGWQTVSFAITSDSLIPGIFGSVNGALMNADTVRIFHNPVAEFGGPNIGPPMVNVQLGLDNISTFSAIPEPGTYVAGLGLAIWCAAIWLRRRAANVAQAPEPKSTS